MAKEACTEDEFIALWQKWGSPSLVARALGIAERSVHLRRRAIEARRGAELAVWNNQQLGVRVRHVEGRIDLDIADGTVVVFSDAHYWPGVRTTAHRALLAMIKQLQPRAVIANGDVFDGATISRWPSINWMDKAKKPTVLEELKACQERLSEIEAVAANADLIWPFGNHDSRFEGKLAASAPEFEGMPGFTLKEYFPRWKPCWTAWINGGTCCTHDYHNGMHAVWNNLIKGQVNYCTGHRHSSEVRAYTNAKGETIYGVDSGTLANAFDSHNVDYQRGRHGNHRSGFAVLTFRGGELLLPELVQVWDEDTVQFRGHLLNADTGELV